MLLGNQDFELIASECEQAVPGQCVLSGAFFMGVYLFPTFNVLICTKNTQGYW